MLKNILLILIVFTSFYSSDTFSAKVKKGIKIYVPLTIGSFEITSSRIKGGKIKKSGDTFEVTDMYVPTKKLTSGIELDWYFDYFVNTTHTIDYSIKEVTTSGDLARVTLERVGVMPMPQDLKVTYKDGSTIEYHIPLVIMRGNRPLSESEILLEDWPWTNPLYTLAVPTKGKRIVSIELDSNLLQADVNRDNNLVEFKGIRKVNFIRD